MTTRRGRVSTNAVRHVAFGIGSWADPEYTGLLYERGLAARERLRVYAGHFDHVEVNASYYRVPARAQVSRWVKQTPPEFGFEIKCHRAFSQSPAGAAKGPLLKMLRHATAPLVAAGRLRAYLLVLPPAFGPARHELAEIERLADGLRPQPLAVELRDRAWITGGQRARTLAFFESRGLVLVSTDMPRLPDAATLPPLDRVTNPELAYLRLHGRNPRWREATSAAERHAHAYSPAELKSIARRIDKLAGAARHVCVVANNHARDYAPRAALALKAMFARRR